MLYNMLYSRSRNLDSSYRNGWILWELLPERISKLHSRLRKQYNRNA